MHCRLSDPLKLLRSSSNCFKLIQSLSLSCQSGGHKHQFSNSLHHEVVGILQRDVLETTSQSVVETTPVEEHEYCRSSLHSPTVRHQSF